ncbi:MAG: STAS domain-containing protein [Thiotrichaceae bacterium]|nr:STAS domain-containing protein [Thiotrichaceae bacterium]
MVEKKSANKKGAKSVLDYDPLAWLAEGDSVEDTEKDKDEPVTPKKVVKKRVVKKVSAKKKSVKKKSSAKKVVKKPVNLNETTAIGETIEMSNSNEENPGYGFFDDSPEPSEIETLDQQNDTGSKSEADQGFGFFDEPDEVKVTESEPETEAEQNLGYGFFDNTDQLDSQSAGLDNSTNIINLGADLTIRSVAACKALIDENITNGFDIKLAAGELQKIDTAGLQLIYSLNHTLEKTSQSITWVSSNSIINDAAKLLGLPQLMESPEDDGAYGFFDDDEKPDTQANQQEEAGFGFF